MARDLDELLKELNAAEKEYEAKARQYGIEKLVNKQNSVSEETKQESQN